MHTWNEKNGVLETVPLPDHFDTSAVKIFSHVLKRAGEPILRTTKRSKGLFFRLVLIRAFEGPIVLTIESKRGRQIIRTKELNMETRHQADVVKKQSIERVTDEEWDRFLSLLDSSRFCRQSFLRPTITPEDGSEWQLERVDSSYCAASMNSPQKSMLHTACLYLLMLGKVSLE